MSNPLLPIAFPTLEAAAQSAQRGVAADPSAMFLAALWMYSPWFAVLPCLPKSAFQLAKAWAKPGPIIEQAAVDVARGLQDTSSGAALNRAYKKLK